tara:strand:+ start:758 stop:1657 length:900 start_codon:yes stop_codon:yes gene_type:complete
MKQHVYQWDNVIIGYSLSALIYAFYTGHPIIGYTRSAPKIIDDFREEVDYAEHGFGKSKTKKQAELWNHLYTLLSMGGQIPFADNTQSIRIDKMGLTGGTLTVVSDNRSKVTKVEYGELWVFNDDGIGGMPPITKASETYRVIDWFNVLSGMKHAHSRIITPSQDFVREIIFYPSERIDGATARELKDLCAISYLQEDELDVFEKSPTYVKFAILGAMEDMGIRGTKNGICSKTGNQKHYALKIQFDRREKDRVAMHGYGPSNRITYHKVSPLEMLTELRREGYNKPANRYIPKVLLTL